MAVTTGSEPLGQPSIPPSGEFAPYSSSMDDRRWADVRYHNVEPPHVSDSTRAQAQQVYTLQREDDGRFRAAADALTAELDPDRRAVLGMTCDRQFVELFDMQVTRWSGTTKANRSP